MVQPPAVNGQPAPGVTLHYFESSWVFSRPLQEEPHSQRREPTDIYRAIVDGVKEWHRHQQQPTGLEQIAKIENRLLLLGNVLQDLIDDNIIKVLFIMEMPGYIIFRVRLTDTDFDAISVDVLEHPQWWRRWLKTSEFDGPEMVAKKLVMLINTVDTFIAPVAVGVLVKPRAVDALVDIHLIFLEASRSNPANDSGRKPGAPPRSHESQLESRHSWDEE